MFDDSGCFLDGTAMRPKVAYLIGAGSVLALSEFWRNDPGYRF